MFFDLVFISSYFHFPFLTYLVLFITCPRGFFMLYLLCYVINYVLYICVIISAKFIIFLKIVSAKKTQLLKM